MNLTLKILRSLSVKSNKQLNFNIKVDQLIRKYEDKFIKQADLFQLPLSKANGVLAYTNRFAKSVLNASNVTLQKKKSHFRKIKGSMLSNNKFTPISCIELCQSLVHFPFEGDQTKILEMLRDYADQTKFLFTGSEIDRFNTSYKYLMVGKLIGSIKFVKFQLKKVELSDIHLVNKLNYLFTFHKIKNFQIKDWGIKKEIKFQIRVGQHKRKIRIKAFDNNLKVDQQELIAEGIDGHAQKNQSVIFLKNCYETVITPDKIAKELLIHSKNWRYLHEIKQQKRENLSQSQHLMLKLKEKIKYASEHIHIVQISPIQYLNAILNFNSQAGLKELFGYVKFNTFHTQLEKLLHLSNIQQRKQLKQIFPLYFSQMLQIEQKIEYNYLSKEWLVVKSLVDLIVQKDLKTVNIYLNENQIYQYLYYLLNYAKSKKIGQTFDSIQNRNLNLMKNKLALSSVLYGLDLKMPILKQDIKVLRKALFPITFQYRFGE